MRFFHCNGPRPAVRRLRVHNQSWASINSARAACVKMTVNTRGNPALVRPFRAVRDGNLDMHQAGTVTRPWKEGPSTGIASPWAARLSR